MKLRYSTTSPYVRKVMVLAIEAGIDGKAVGKITVTDYAAYVAIARGEADKALGRLLNGRIKGRKFKVRSL